MYIYTHTPLPIYMLLYRSQYKSGTCVFFSLWVKGTRELKERRNGEERKRNGRRNRERWGKPRKSEEK